MDIRELINNYINLKKSNDCSNITITNYSIRLNEFIDFLSCNYNTNNIEMVDEDVIIAFKNYLIEIRKNNKNTIREKIVELKAFFDYACARKELKGVYENPMTNILVPGKENIVKNFFNTEETQHFINQLINCNENNRLLMCTGLHKNNFTRNASILLVALTTAVRVSALANVRFKDYDPHNKTMIFRVVKGGGEQIKFLQNFVINIIDDYINNYRPKGLPDNAPLWVIEKTNSNNPNIKSNKQSNIYVDEFTHVEYTELNRISLTTMCKNYTKVLGGKTLSMHELRHSSAMYVFEAGGSVADIQQVLGHKNALTTENYLHSLSNKREQLVVNNAWKNIQN